MKRLALGMASILVGPWGLVGCFHGDSTLGSICREDADCGAEQSCENEVCGLCGDDSAQPGELCSVEAAPLPSSPLMTAGPLLLFDRGLDGKLEIVTRGEDGTVEQWQGDGEGGFAVVTRMPEGGTTGLVRPGELDQDEMIDLVVVDADAQTLALGYGNAEDGWSFEAPVALQAVPSDLAVGGAWADSPVWIAWVDERGLWQALLDPETRLLGAAARLTDPRPQWIGEAVALDDDALLDLLVVDVDGMALEPWLGDSAGGLMRGETLPLEARATDLLTIDAEGDGDADAFVLDEEGGITVIIDAGDELLTIGRVTTEGAIRGMTVVDLDRDFDRDLVVSVDQGPPLRLLPLRSGWYTDSIMLPAPDAAGTVRGADVDGDGMIELLLGPSEGVGPLRVVEVEP
jgi:hypothetical protein